MQIQGQVKVAAEGASARRTASNARTLRRSKLALDALHAALRSLAARLRGEDRELCARAVERIDELHDALCELEAPDSAEQVSASRSTDGRDCSLGTVCHAARTSLGEDFHDRVLVALDPLPAEARVDGESAVRSLRRLLRCMFASGAGAVLLHAHVEGERAVFALVDDHGPREAGAERYADDIETTQRELAEVGGSASAIDTPDEDGEGRSVHGAVLTLPLGTTREGSRA